MTFYKPRYIRVRLRWIGLPFRHAGGDWPCPYWWPWTAPPPAETPSPSVSTWISSSFLPSLPSELRPLRCRISASTSLPRCSPSAPVAAGQRVRSVPPPPVGSITVANKGERDRCASGKFIYLFIYLYEFCVNMSVSTTSSEMLVSVRLNGLCSYHK